MYKDLPVACLVVHPLSTSERGGEGVSLEWTVYVVASLLSTGTCLATQSIRFTRTGTRMRGDDDMGSAAEDRAREPPFRVSGFESDS